MGGRGKEGVREGARDALAMGMTKTTPSLVPVLVLLASSSTPVHWHSYYYYDHTAVVEKGAPSLHSFVRCKFLTPFSTRGYLTT